MIGVYELILRAPSGEERTTLIWFPAEYIRLDYYEKVRKQGIEITEEKEIM
jgi:hypothetical protein